METPATPPPHFMTTREVAALIRKTPHAVRQIRHRGTGPKRGRRVGRDTLYPRAAVMEWLDALEQADPLALRWAMQPS
ncbi:helix-turn-helix domain-containing protein [Streptomyces rubiginosohelvolus]|uniref:helix-turn-helix domain-containing protein n=1 Tax=Streptomyces rubiginosohelvolus TaxID=67362 RepID=UPI0036F8EFE6